MIGMQLKAAQAQFFDRAHVIGATSRAERQVLSKFGAYVRQRARTSIRPRKGTSAPGTPPHSHTGLLRRNIFFAYNRERASVIIGAVQLNAKAGLAPHLLEHGGRTLVRRGGRRQPAKYRPRPYMRPAFEAEQAKLPSLWKNSVR